MTRDSAHTMLAVGVAALAIICALQVKKAWGQDGSHGQGHAQMHPKYETWRVPSNPNVSCCSGEDCRPTRSFMGDDGQWRAWNGTMWMVVPQSALLPTDLAGDGRSHICERSGFLYCFSPTEPKG